MLDIYIDNKRMDIDENTSIALNYTAIEVDNPSIVKNSYSKSIDFLGTPNNNRVFLEMWKLDAFTQLGAFDSRKRVPCQIYNNGDIVGDGYLSLDKITNRQGLITYSTTFYNGLGDFFYELHYNENGVERTLADLTYGFNGESSDVDSILLRWNKDYIDSSWNKLWNWSSSDMSVDNWITAAPTYSGYYDDFDNDKVLVSTRNDLPVRTLLSLSDDETYYKDWSLVTADRDMDEWECRDLRARYQRPCIKLSIVMQAISNPINNGGYTIEWDDDVFDETTDIGRYFNKSYIILNRIDFSTEDGTLTDFVTKRMLLGHGSTPCEYLLGFTKLFNLKYLKDNRRKKISILQRHHYYLDEVVNIDHRIDRSKDIELMPTYRKYKWYQFSLDTPDTYASYLYSKRTAVPFGAFMQNTGYEFNSNTNNIFDGNKYQNVIPYRHRSVYFNLFNFNVDILPPCLFPKPVTYSVIDKDGKIIEKMGKDTSFLYPMANKKTDAISKLCMFDKDNSAMDITDVLVFFNGFKTYEYPFIVSDDIPMFERLNGGNPCHIYTKYEDGWISDSVYGKVCNRYMNLPQFSKYLEGSDGRYIASWDFNKPLITFIDDNAVYDGACTIFSQFWYDYVEDLLHPNTKYVTLYCYIREKCIENILRKVYFFDGGYWVINDVTDYDPQSDKAVKVSFIKVHDYKKAYLNKK